MPKVTRSRDSWRTSLVATARRRRSEARELVSSHVFRACVATTNTSSRLAWRARDAGLDAVLLAAARAA